MEWAMTDYACACQSYVLVPVYDSYPQEDCEAIIIHSGIRAIVCAAERVSFIQAIKEKISCELEFIIVIDNGAYTQNDGSVKLPQYVTHTFTQIMALGKEKPLEDVPVDPHALYSIVYTSGTTGYFLLKTFYVLL
jgi:long-chain acyl-CoA synthetase